MQQTIKTPMAKHIFMLQHLFLLYKFLLKLLSDPHWKNKSYGSQLKCEKYQSFSANRQTAEELMNATIVFEVEGALLRSSSLFPYFLLVAFEGGGILRALVLFLLYPLICLVSREKGLKMMVFICFFGVKKETFVIGRTVLPKFFLEEVGFEGFELVMKCGRKVGVSELPRVMVEGFLKDYLGVECVFRRDLKVVCGYFVGLMEKEVETTISSKSSSLMNDDLGERKSDCHLIGFASSNKLLDDHLFSHCKEIYLVNESEKKKWRVLPRNKYPKPLIFHDGRIAFKPTYLATLSMLMWVPFGLVLALIRLMIALFLPYPIAIPIFSFIGMGGRMYIRCNNNLNINQKDDAKRCTKGTVYVCNHRTLLDPIYISIALRKPVIAVTYSLSRVSEFLSPIKTVHLMRNKENDSNMMKLLLSEDDIVVCPEGTTCREPYVLRFSPLFGEISDEIAPIAIDAKVGMFYGTTARGFKFLDPLFFLMNPDAKYYVTFLERFSISDTHRNNGLSRIDVANRVQKDIAETLGFECTNLTRKNKYMILAGNEGTV